MSFAEKLRERRIACRMSVEELAIAVGTSRQTIHRYETGRILRPPYEKIEALAAALSVAPGELMGWQQGSPQEHLDPISVDEAELAFITVADDAMSNDRILEQDVVYYRPCETITDGNLTVLTWDHSAMVRRIYKAENGIWLLPSNSAYPPQFISSADFARLTILGTAVVLRTLL